MAESERYTRAGPGTPWERLCAATGTRPSISTTWDQLKNVRITSRSPRTATLEARCLDMQVAGADISFDCRSVKIRRPAAPAHRDDTYQNCQGDAGSGEIAKCIAAGRVHHQVRRVARRSTARREQQIVPPRQSGRTASANPTTVHRPASRPPRWYEKGISEFVSIHSTPPPARAASSSPVFPVRPIR